MLQAVGISMRQIILNHQQYAPVTSNDCLPIFSETRPLNDSCIFFFVSLRLHKRRSEVRDKGVVGGENQPRKEKDRITQQTRCGTSGNRHQALHGV